MSVGAPQITRAGRAIPGQGKGNHATWGRLAKSVMHILPYGFVILSLHLTSCTPNNPSPRAQPQPIKRVQPPPATLPQYTVCRTDTGIRIDGVIDENDWNRARPMRFVSPWNNVEREGRQDTVARLLWDDTYLYIVYQCVDPFLHATVTTRDGPVYEEDAVEFFATPNAQDISAYYGFEMNVRGALFDYIAFGGGKKWTANLHPGWQSEGVNIASTYHGTLNNHSDIDQGWILESAIPLENFRHLGGQIPPRDGDRWRGALNRTAGFKGQFSLWSDTHTPNPAFHHAAYFGNIDFSSGKVGSAACSTP